MSPNDPLFLSEIHTWCPRCGTQHAGSAGELSERPEIACRRCRYVFAVDPHDLQREIAARRVADAGRHYLYASRSQQPLYSVAAPKTAE